MTPPQPPTNRPGDPDTDPTRVVSPDQRQRDQGQYAFGVQPPAPGVPPQPGYGWQTPPRYGPQTGPAYWPQAGSGYGPPGYGQHGYGQPPGYEGVGPNKQQFALWITLGAVTLLGLLGALLTVTLLVDLNSAVNRFSDMCNQYGGQMSEMCRESLRSHGVKVPMAATIYLGWIILGSLAAFGGAVLVLVKKHFGQFLILGGGAVMLLFAIFCTVHYGSTPRVTYGLIAGALIAIAGGLFLVPPIRRLLGLPPRSGTGRFGDGGQQPYGQPYPGHYGQPWSGGYPPRQW